VLLRTTILQLQMQEKQMRKLDQLAAQQARLAYKDMLRSKRQREEAAKQRKDENRRKNDIKHGVVLSSQTARKLLKDKKFRKQVVTT
jgi:hypothetical protein